MITKEDLRKMNDEQLLELINKAKNEHHTGKEFGETFKCDFSYSYLTEQLKKRGWTDGWHKADLTPSVPTEADIITMKKSDDNTVRQSYQISEKVAKEWKEFNKDIPYKTVTLDAALSRFMSDCKSGKIKFEISFKSDDA